ncbi:MAG: PIG-L family deacetylase [Lachnospiraceae bacterium]|nr:PIG-L family deacetylase [Lachnospiraceae bacterium]
MNEVVLILAPHTDDGELACGGTIARFLEEKKDVYYVAFSTCRNSVPPGYPPDRLEKELKLAMKSYGIDDEHVIILDYPVREFNSHRQEILDDMILIGKKLNPTYVFAPSLNDVHQDHHVIAEESIRAFKKTTLFAYEVPWNNLHFSNQTFIKLEKRHIEQKMKAIACYESQKIRAYAAPDFTIGQARTHGVQVGCEYAEVFELVRWIF